MSCCSNSKSLCGCCDFGGWWMIVLFFIFIGFQDCIEDICLADWIPFLILVLICCSCNSESECCDC